MNPKPPTTRRPWSTEYLPSMIREAVGLEMDEKVMLFVIASHLGGKAFASRAKFERQLAFKGNRLYAVRKKLKAKGLIDWTERGIGKSTIYTINEKGLQRWLLRRDLTTTRVSKKPAQTSIDWTKPRLVGRDGVNEILRDGLAQGLGD